MFGGLMRQLKIWLCICFYICYFSGQLVMNGKWSYAPSVFMLHVEYKSCYKLHELVSFQIWWHLAI
jgi:hypothetical protein